MTAERYRTVYNWFNQRPRLRRAFTAAVKSTPAVPVVLYGVLLVLRAADAVSLRSAGGEAFRASLVLLLRSILVPFFTFVGGSLLRSRLNRPRPYEQPGFVPLVQKDTRGKSFPSRHALSAGVIAMAWLRTSIPVGLFLILWAFWVCFTRVIGGMHSEKDVVCGAGLGFLAGAAGMFL